MYNMYKNVCCSIVITARDWKQAISPLNKLGYIHTGNSTVILKNNVGLHMH